MRPLAHLSSLLFAAVLLIPASEISNAQVYPSSAGNILVQTFAKGLEHPWALAFLPDGRILVTERPGRMRIIAKDGTISPALSSKATSRRSGCSCNLTRLPCLKSSKEAPFTSKGPNR